MDKYRSDTGAITKSRSRTMNYPLCFTTITTILDWVTSSPASPQEDLLKELEQLRKTVDHKIAVVVERLDKKRIMGRIGTS
jgi:hypothetical protein